jgi:hypothetical protein
MKEYVIQERCLRGLEGSGFVLRNVDVIKQHTYAVTECFVDRIGSDWLDALSRILGCNWGFHYCMLSSV